MGVLAERAIVVAMRTQVVVVVAVPTQSVFTTPTLCLPLCTSLWVRLVQVVAVGVAATALVGERVLIQLRLIIPTRARPASASRLLVVGEAPVEQMTITEQAVVVVAQAVVAVPLLQGVVQGLVEAIL